MGNWSNEEVKESGASKASLIRGLLHTYRQEKALERIREARREYEAGLGIEGDLATLLEKM